MRVKSEELRRFKTNVIYDYGYRVVYYYEKYHEVPQTLYAENIEDFICFFKEKNKKIKYNGTQDLLKRFLEKVPDALGVAIYDIDQNCIVKLIKGGVKKINDTVVYKEELIYDYNYVTVKDGFRIVYLYNDGTYKLGVGAKNIEDFMKEFTPYEPIDELCEIPPFISVEDLLNRYLEECQGVDGVALYNVDGTLIDQRNRINSNIKQNLI